MAKSLELFSMKKNFRDLSGMNRQELLTNLDLDPQLDHTPHVTENGGSDRDDTELVAVNGDVDDISSRPSLSLPLVLVLGLDMLPLIHGSRIYTRIACRALLS